MPGSKKPLRYEGVERRVQLVALLMTLALSVLCGQLWRLQMVHLAEFRELAEDNRVWPKRLKSERGVIYASDGTVLADNRASADVVLVPGDCPKDRFAGVCDSLERLIGAPAENTMAKIQESAGEPFTQITVKRDVSKASLIRVEEHTFDLPGVFTVVRPQRRYRHGKTAGQVLGYLNEITQDEFETWEDYSKGDLVGRSGLEGRYEQWLHGHDGYMLVTKYAAGLPQLRTDAHGVPYIAERDSLGNILEEEGRRQEPAAGKPLRLTMDIDLQAYCENLLGDEVGSIVVLDADTGGALALASTPSYDPNLFVNRDFGASKRKKKKAEAKEKAAAPESAKPADTEGEEASKPPEAETGNPDAVETEGENVPPPSPPESSAKVPENPEPASPHGKNELLELLRPDPSQPNRMIHRAYAGQYPPGSIFKVFLASAALQEGVITPQTSFFCPGHFQIGGQGNSWYCWRHSGHGSVTVVEALAYSCDVFFYNVGLKLGVDKISKWAHKLGMSEKTGIDLPGEMPGLIPDPEWKKSLNKGKPVWTQNWYPGETVNLSIGQGGAMTTPLQNAVLMASILNGGYRVRPYLNQELGAGNSERLFSESTIATVVKGMRLCVEDGPPAPTGTGHVAYTPGMIVLGKTGSAQVVSLKIQKMYKRPEDVPYKFREHAWFVAGVLDRQPRLAICVLVEHGLHGAEAAAPLAKKVIDFYYAKTEDKKSMMARQGDSDGALPR